MEVYLRQSPFTGLHTAKTEDGITITLHMSLQHLEQ